MVTRLTDLDAGARQRTRRARPAPTCRCASRSSASDCRWVMSAGRRSGRPGRPVVEEHSSGDGSAENDTSIVGLAPVGGVRVLATGDVEPAVQSRLEHAVGGGLAVDVLKVPHHGSRYQDPEFLAVAHARVALISVGAGNDYGHPAAQTVASLASSGDRCHAHGPERNGPGGRGSPAPAGDHSWCGRRVGSPWTATSLLGRVNRPRRRVVSEEVSACSLPHRDEFTMLRVSRPAAFSPVPSSASASSPAPPPLPPRAAGQHKAPTITARQLLEAPIQGSLHHRSAALRRQARRCPVGHQPRTGRARHQRPTRGRGAWPGHPHDRRQPGRAPGRERCLQRRRRRHDRDGSLQHRPETPRSRRPSSCPTRCLAPAVLLNPNGNAATYIAVTGH